MDFFSNFFLSSGSLEIEEVRKCSIHHFLSFLVTREIPKDNLMKFSKVDYGVVFDSPQIATPGHLGIMKERSKMKISSLASGKHM